MELHQDQAIRLNLGAGHKKIEGWLSVDLAGEPDVRSDVLSLPFADESVEAIMAIHLFEHLYRWDVDAALAEWRRVLKPGGTLILEMPDLIKCCRNILKGKGERLGVWGCFGDPGYREPLMVHKWGWTQEELKMVLEAAGFRKLKFSEPVFHKRDRDMRVECVKC